MADEPMARPDVPELIDPHRPLTREYELWFEPPAVREPMFDEHQAQYSRTARTGITFGLPGRLVATGVLVAIPVIAFLVSPVFIIFDGIYLYFLVVGLRDVWQPGLVKPRTRLVTDHTRLATDPGSAPLPSPAESAMPAGGQSVSGSDVSGPLS
jgi:hypothetical protein